MDCLTSKPCLVRSWSTAQDASKSRPLMLMDPNLMEVGGLGAWRGAVGSLVWSFFLKCFVNFCLCLFGQYVSRSMILLVLFLNSIVFRMLEDMTEVLD